MNAMEIHKGLLADAPGSGERILPSALCVLLDGLALALFLGVGAVWMLSTVPQCGVAWLSGLTWAAWLIAVPMIPLALGLCLRWALRHAPPAPRGLWERTWGRRLCMSLATPLLFLMACEFALEIVGFEAPVAPIAFRGNTEQNPEWRESIQNDPDLLWRLQPGARFDGRRVNSLGFLEREIDPDKEPGTMRVISLGDSCTAQGYSALLQDHLTLRPPTPARWEAFNMGVHGYSVAQGHRLFEVQGLKLKPDIVTLYFGWNCHWEYDYTDLQRMSYRVKDSWATWAFNRLSLKRFGQLLIKLATPGRQLLATRRGLRVPPADYTNILVGFIRDIRAAGAHPLVITAPSGPLRDIGPTYASSTQAAERLHEDYVQLTRATAQSLNASVLDLHAMMEPPEYQATCFTASGIHLTPTGLAMVAEALYQKIQQLSMPMTNAPPLAMQ